MAFIGMIAMLVLNETRSMHTWTMREVITNVAKDNWNLLFLEVNKNPIKVKATTSGIVYVLGDLIS